MSKHPFKDAIRSQKSLLTPLEKKCLYWVACQLPSFVSSDHLTLLGFFAMFLAGVSFYDVSGAIATLSLAVVLVISVIRHTRELYEAEKI